jgi:hypothetical protein
VSPAILDDHLLRDLLADDLSPGLAGALDRHEPATTNLYLYRLSRGVISARGGALTGGWTPEQRRAPGIRAAMVDLGLDYRTVTR